MASIGQSIIQHCRSRAVLALLQVAVGVQLYHLYESKFLINELHRLGFFANYHEVLYFVKSGACSRGTDIPNFDSSEHTLHFGGDNVDCNIKTIDGKNQVHWMGMLVSVVPRIINNERIPRSTDASSYKLRAAAKLHFINFKHFKGNMRFSNLTYSDKRLTTSASNSCKNPTSSMISATF